MENKRCFKCGYLKPLTDFYRHNAMADKHLNKCKSCTKSDVKSRQDALKSDQTWVETERARGREKYHRLGYTGKSKPEANKRWLDKFPEKRKAHIASGRLPPPEVGLEKHHWSYNEEHHKDVIWLSKRDHTKAHRFIIYDQERMMYRGMDGILLDSLDVHSKYIFDKIKTEKN